MLNFSFIIIFSFILVYQNVIILNEEALILICFITFCVLVHSKLNKSIYDELFKQSTSIKNSIESSLDSLSNELVKGIKTQKNSKNLALNFKNLGNHFLELSFSLSDKIPLLFIRNHEKIYPKKIVFTIRLEQQTTKLLALLLSHKLAKAVYLKRFYTYNFKVSPLLCINKVVLREYLETI
uniref:ATP synthase B chain precursor n=1 Tax=Mimica arnoldii TaxID=88407 RepID=UPI0027AA5F87|nr:ATP synthase B chain precursor [Mimica arnoldii]WGO62536.1 ATP synthase B chain precursor [Mimica arnoldii]